MAARKQKNGQRNLIIGASCALIGSVAWLYRHSILRLLRGWPRIEGYTLVRYLNKGAYGKVYEAVGHESGSRVAAKVIMTSSLPYRERRQIKNEIAAMQSLDHPNIIRLHDVKKTDRYTCLLIDYAAGGELMDRLLDKEEDDVSGFGLPEDRARDIAKQLISAIMYIHDRGIIHRDLKPENVLLVTDKADSPIKICDFGCAKVVKHVGTGPVKPEELHASTVTGTMGYQAPGVESGDYNFMVDYWSIGIITFILLSGNQPMGNNFPDASSPGALNLKKLRSLMSTRDWRFVSDGAKDFVERLLDKKSTGSQLLQHKWMTA